MRVLIVSSVTPVRGGVSTWIEEVTTELLKQGHYAKIINVAGVKTNSFNYFKSSVMKVISTFLKNDLIFLLIFTAARYVIKIRVISELRKRKYDIVHAQDINAFNGIYKYCNKNRIKLVLSVHGHLYNAGTATRKIAEGSWLSRCMYKSEVNAFKNAQKIITVSNYSFQFVLSIVDKNKVELIRNFVNTEVYYPLPIETKKDLRKAYAYKEEDFVLIYAGRLTKAKGVNNILEGICICKDSIPVKLIVAGDGPERLTLQQYVKKNRLNNCVQFLGQVEKKELLNLYRLADAFVMASVSNEENIEGTPMALLEAMACGLPVITTPVGGIGDIMHDEKNSLLFSEKNGNAVASAIKRLYADKDIRRKIIEHSLMDIRSEYSLDLVINRIMNVYLN